MLATAAPATAEAARNQPARPRSPAPSPNATTVIAAGDGQPPRGQLHAQQWPERSPSHDAAPTSAAHRSGDKLAPLQFDHSVTCREQCRRVGGHDGGGVTGHLADHLDDLGLAGRVQVSGWLVHEEELGALEKCSGQSDAVGLTS